ncbi:MAG: hypothetical protein GY869_15960 [Planctomycetes bacterium]|nr:hypothetical protein [Planctomycetota bacterium]
MMEMLENISVGWDRRGARAAEVAFIEMRLGLLKKVDRLLPELYYSKGLTFREIGQLIGVEERKVARRIRQLKERLLGDEYISIVRRKGEFSAVELEVAYDRYILGLGYRRVAKKRGMGEREVVRIIRRLKVQCSRLKEGLRLKEVQRSKAKRQKILTG